MKAILDIATIEKYILLHKKLRLPFTLIISNYTTRIVSKCYDIHFMKTEQGNRMFAAFSMIKSDCLKKKLPLLKKDTQYYSHAFKEAQFYADTIYNFDLKAAYAYILYIDNFISKKTLDYILKMPKMQRLTAVGMLAGKKEVFKMNADGDPINSEIIISPTANYFFYCVQRTAEIINECSQLLGNGFLFSWVDGIYFTENPDTVEKSSKIILEEFFKEKKLKVSFEILTQFNVEMKKTHFNCTYYKENALKSMKVPRIEYETVKKITDFLLNRGKNLIL